MRLAQLHVRINPLTHSMFLHLHLRRWHEITARVRRFIAVFGPGPSTRCKAIVLPAPLGRAYLTLRASIFGAGAGESVLVGDFVALLSAADENVVADAAENERAEN